MRVQILSACLALAAPMALACPTGQDMTKGIRFTVDGTDTETFRRTGPGMIEANFTTSDGIVSRNLLAQGVYLVEWVDIVDGAPDPNSRTTYAFPGTAEDLMVPEPGRSVTYDVVVNSQGSLDKERQIYSFGQKSLLNFGACEYDMIVIELRYDGDTADTVDYLYYMPEFGFSYYAGNDSADGSNRYMYSNIEVIE